METNDLIAKLAQEAWPVAVRKWEMSYGWDGEGYDGVNVWVYLDDPLGESHDVRDQIRGALRDYLATHLDPAPTWVSIWFRDIAEPVPEPTG